MQRPIRNSSVSGVNYLVNGRGAKTAVVIDLKKHRRLWEDIYDQMLINDRRSEARESLEAVRKKLKSKRTAHA